MVSASAARVDPRRNGLATSVIERPRATTERRRADVAWPLHRLRSGLRRAAPLGGIGRSGAARHVSCGWGSSSTTPSKTRARSPRRRTRPRARSPLPRAPSSWSPSPAPPPALRWESVAGPAGIVAGALIGGFAATLAGTVAHSAEVERREHDRELDREIGVTEGDLGAAVEGAPPAQRGFSLASMGIHGAGRTPAEGPIRRSRRRLSSEAASATGSPPPRRDASAARAPRGA